jgi:Zn-dependent M28 family amino/carboxypeptidase
MATQPDPAPEPAVEPAAASPLTDDSVDAPEAADANPGTDAGVSARGTAAEAKRYRLKLRETEAERDRLAALVERHRRADVERALSESKLADPADLWRDGLTLDELLDDDGSIDDTKLADAVAAVLAAHPSWAKPTRKPVDLGQGPRGEPTPKVGLDAAIRDAVRRR